MASNSRELLLRAIGASSTLPVPQLIADYHSLNLKTLPLTHEERDQLAASERERLMEFREQYWSLEPSDRTRRWTQLMNSCDSRESQATLARWKLGLMIPAISPEELKETKLPSFVAETFLLPPRERAIRRLRWLNEVAIPNQVVLNFLKQQVAFYSLDPLLFQEIVKKNGMSVREFLTAEFAKNLESTSFQFVREGMGFRRVEENSDRELNSVQGKKDLKRTEVQEPKAISSFEWRYICAMCVGMVIAYLFFFSGASKDSSAKPPKFVSDPVYRQKANVMDAHNKQRLDILESQRKFDQEMMKSLRKEKNPQFE